MRASDPVMDVLDKLPMSSPTSCAEEDLPDADTPSAVPFGLRFAASPLAPRCGEHSKTYYTVTEKEATVITHDGTTETRQDDVQRERED